MTHNISNNKHLYFSPLNDAKEEETNILADLGQNTMNTDSPFFLNQFGRSSEPRPLNAIRISTSSNQSEKKEKERDLSFSNFSLSNSSLRLDSPISDSDSESESRLAQFRKISASLDLSAAFRITEDEVKEQKDSSSINSLAQSFSPKSKSIQETLEKLGSISISADEKSEVLTPEEEENEAFKPSLIILPALLRQQREKPIYNKIEEDQEKKDYENQSKGKKRVREEINELPRKRQNTLSTEESELSPQGGQASDEELSQYIE